MSGVYIHIPFCRQACHYCNFHFSVSQKMRPGFLQALKKEILWQKDYLPFDADAPGPDTLYLGGGTPSVLSRDELWEIFEVLREVFVFSPFMEITLEANPDDLDQEKLAVFKELSVNRLSIGVQSFQQADLQYMNRSHDAQQALKAIQMAQAAGFQNLTADLIYGTPGMTDAQWKDNIQRLVDLDVPHISAYALTVEKQTALEVFIRKGKAAAVEEEQAARQFDILCQMAARYGYEHYEVSNFGKPGFFSRHNLSYWSGKSYLGLGPSAHSYKPGVRQWNVSHTQLYIREINNGRIPSQKEILTTDQQYNEYVMTALRTMWGVDQEKVKSVFGDAYEAHLLKSAGKYFASGKLVQQGSHLVVTPQGKFFADGIAADLFI